MITQTENAAALAQNSAFIAQVAAYKQLLTDHNFPFTVDMQVLATTLRTQLFQKLLAVDKGLKMRWDMLRTDEARIKLITDTIDLNGYDVVDEAQEAVKALETGYNRMYVGELGYMGKQVPFRTFAQVYALDLQALLDSKTFDWTGKQHVLDYFQALGEMLREFRGIGRVVSSTSFSLYDAGAVLPRYFQEVNETVVVNEGGVMRLVNDLEKAGKLSMIPRA